MQTTEERKAYMRAYSKKYYAKHRTRHKKQTTENQRRRWKEMPEHMAALDRRKLLRRKYGLSVAMYDELVALQDSCCASCGHPETATVREKRMPLAVDHNHDTGSTRGLLCGRCNTALGLLKDDPLRIRALLAYREKY